MTYVLIMMCFAAMWAVIQPLFMESDMPKGGSPENRKKNYYPPEF
jgi:hypothetical protein